MVRWKRNTEVSFASYNGRDQVQGWIYVPACKPKGIVQVIHGFGEHSRRYLHMISAFMDAGYIVAADDHVGHGKTAMVNNVWGDWGDKGPHTMMEDEHTLKEIVCEKYPDLPYFLFGHSMGSFITRDFIAKYGDELAGATICGTTGIFRGAEETGKKLKEAIDAGHGEESDLSYTGELMGWMCERCGEVSIGNEWICADPYVQRDHAEDPFDAFTRPTSNRSIYDFIQMMEQIEGKGDIVKITGVSGNAADTIREQANDDILAEYPDVNVLTSAPGNWSQTDAQSVMTTFLSTR